MRRASRQDKPLLFLLVNSKSGGECYYATFTCGLRPFSLRRCCPYCVRRVIRQGNLLLFLFNNHYSGSCPVFQSGKWIYLVTSRDPFFQPVRRIAKGFVTQFQIFVPTYAHRICGNLNWLLHYSIRGHSPLLLKQFTPRGIYPCASPCGLLHTTDVHYIPKLIAWG